MLSNFKKGISFYCMNDQHEEPVLMVYKEGNSRFYACPRYVLSDKQHPDGHERFEPACHNRLSYVDAEKIATMLSDEVQETMSNGELCDFTGHMFKLRDIQVCILRYTDGDIRIGILNKGALV